MVCGGNVVGVNRAPIGSNYIVINEDDKGMIDGDVTFISNFLYFFIQTKIVC